MFVFGHIGIGRTLTGPWRRRLPALPFIVGALLPDLIDKPLYYSRLWEYVSCTRTFGHTGLLLAGIVGVAFVARSRGMAALALGVATHLVLDFWLDLFGDQGPSGATWTALTWPLLHREFAHVYISSVSSHIGRLWATPVVAAEVIGLLLLGWEWWRWTRRSAAPTNKRSGRRGPAVPGGSRTPRRGLRPSRG